MRMIRLPGIMALGDNDMLRELANQFTLYESNLICATDAEHLARIKLYNDDKVCGLTKRILKAQQLFLDRLEAWANMEYFTQTQPAERARVFTALVQLASVSCVDHFRCDILLTYHQSACTASAALGASQVIVNAASNFMVCDRMPLTHKVRKYNFFVVRGTFL